MTVVGVCLKSAGVHMNGAIVNLLFSHDDHVSSCLIAFPLLHLTICKKKNKMFSVWSSCLTHHRCSTRLFCSTFFSVSVDSCVSQSDADTPVVVPTVCNVALTPHLLLLSSPCGRKHLLQSVTYPLCNVATVHRPGRSW